MAAYPSCLLLLSAGAFLGYWLTRSDPYREATRHYYSGDFAQTVTILSDGVKDHPNRADFHNLLGLAYQRQGRQDEARLELQAAVEIDPKYADAWYNLGNLYRDQKDTGRAGDAYKHATEAEPDFADAYYNWGSHWPPQSAFLRRLKNTTRLWNMKRTETPST
jgi:tetratricopeptide (TPR) repeat protein